VGVLALVSPTRWVVVKRIVTPQAPARQKCPRKLLLTITLYLNNLLGLVRPRMSCARIICGANGVHFTVLTPLACVSPPVHDRTSQCTFLLAPSLHTLSRVPRYTALLRVACHHNYSCPFCVHKSAHITTTLTLLCSCKLLPSLLDSFWRPFLLVPSLHALPKVHGHTALLLVACHYQYSCPFWVQKSADITTTLYCWY
jgi:hypothetical protein